MKARSARGQQRGGMRHVGWVLAAAMLVVPMAAEAQRVTDGLVGLWRFEETTGATVADSSGNGHDGDVVSFGSGEVVDLGVDGVLGSAVKFPLNDDENASFVAVPSHPDFDITGDITMEFWIKIPVGWSSDGQNVGTVMARGDQTYQIREQANNSLRFAGRDRVFTPPSTYNGGMDANNETSRPVLVEDEWVHVAFVAESLAVTWYINGEPDNNTTVRPLTDPIGTPDKTPATEDDTLQIGGQFNPDGNPRRNLNAMLDEVALYNRALSQAEVQQNMQLGIDGGLVAHWKFEETSGTTVEDSSGNGHPLTLKTVGGADLPDLAVPGRVGSGISIPATPGDAGGFGEADDHADFDITESFTLSAWVNVPDPWDAPDWAQIVAKADTSYGLRRNSGTRRVRFDQRDDTDPDNKIQTNILSPDGVEFPANAWMQVTGVFDFAAGTTHLYFDGVEVNQGTRPDPIGVTDFPVQVGINLSTDGVTYRRNFGGLIDEVRIYRHAMSPGEVLALFESDSQAGGEVQGNVIVSNVYPPFIDEGTTVILTGPEGSNYQWRKNDVAIGGATSRTLTFDPVTEEDAGQYTVRYDDGTKAVVVTPPFNLEVEPEGSVPVAGGLGLAALLGACALGGARLIRRRK